MNCFVSFCILLYDVDEKGAGAYEKSFKSQSIMIRWFSPKAKEGIASLNQSSIQLNAVASTPFQYAFRVQVGVDEKNNIIIEPLTRDKVESGVYDEYGLLKVQLAKTFTRISSRDLMKGLSEMTGIHFGEEAQKFPTSWDEKINQLTIHCGGKE